MRAFCAADRALMTQLNSLDTIARACWQQQDTDRQRLQQQYIDTEAALMERCVEDSTAFAALTSMGGIALDTLTQAG
jgi:hypothetical protein